MKLFQKLAVLLLSQSRQISVAWRTRSFGFLLISDKASFFLSYFPSGWVDGLFSSDQLASHYPKGVGNFGDKKQQRFLSSEQLSGCHAGFFKRLLEVPRLAKPSRPVAVAGMVTVIHELRLESHCCQLLGPLLFLSALVLIQGVIGTELAPV